MNNSDRIDTIRDLLWEWTEWLDSDKSGVIPRRLDEYDAACYYCPYVPITINIKIGDVKKNNEDEIARNNERFG